MPLKTVKSSHQSLHRLIVCIITISMMSTSLLALDLEWSINLDQVLPNYSFPLGIGTDPGGNVISASSAFDEWQRAATVKIFKTDVNGNLVWRYEFAPENTMLNPTEQSIAFDEDGSVILAIHDFDLTVHVAKVDPDGNLAWHDNMSRIIQGPHKEIGIQILADGNYLVSCINPARNGSTIYLFWFSPEGELVQTASSRTDRICENSRIRVNQDYIVVSLTEPPIGDRFFTWLAIYKYNHNGDLVWEGNIDQSRGLGALLDDMQLTEENVATMYWVNDVQNEASQFEIVAFDLNEEEVIWQRDMGQLTYPHVQGQIDANIVLGPDGNIYSSGAIGGNYIEPSDPYIFKANIVNGDLDWDYVERWRDDEIHSRGTGNHILHIADNSVFMAGFTNIPNDIQGMLRPAHSFVMQFDLEGNQIARHVTEDNDWRWNYGWMMTSDNNGNLYLLSRKINREDFGPNIQNTIELQRFTVGDPPPPPRLEFFTEEILFGEVYIGDSASEILEIPNTGEGRGTIYRVTFQNVIDRFEVEQQLPLNIEADNEGQLTVIWFPQAEGNLDGEMRIYHNDQTIENPYIIYLFGESADAPPPPPHLDLLADEINFGNVNVGDTATVILEIPNMGDGVGTISRVTFQNVIDEIQIEQQLPLTIEPNSESQLTIIWSPQLEGNLDGEMSIYHNDPLIDNPYVIFLIGESALDVDEESVNLPELYFLSAAYPNPFNATTNIVFGLKEDSDIHLAVFDMLGEQVALLADGICGAGVHNITWNGDQISGGVYIVQLRSKQFEARQKLILMK